MTIDAELISALRARARDPERRTDAASEPLETKVGALSVAKLSLGSLFGHRVPAPPPPSEAPSPVSQEQLSAAEAAIGFSLPADLEQLYREVADGGFGPGDGLLSLGEAIATYQEFTALSPSPGGQPWPSDLLPIKRWDVGCTCLDRTSGEVIFWDEEDLASGSSAKVWERSFKREATDVAEWLRTWVSGSTQNALQDPLLEERRRQVRAIIEDFRSMSSEERTAHGLPEDDWEELIYLGHGLDPEDV